MFCDLVGSTALSARLDPEDMREIIGTYHRCCAEQITKAGGFVAKYMGDGVLGYFGYPQAHEDDAERAVRGALSLVEAVPMLRTGHEAGLQVRVGIATGLVAVGRHGRPSRSRAELSSGPRRREKAERKAPWNCGHPRASPASGATKATAPKPAISSRRSTAGSPKASTRRTSRRQRRCWRSWDEKRSEESSESLSGGEERIAATIHKDAEILQVMIRCPDVR